MLDFLSAYGIMPSCICIFLSCFHVVCLFLFGCLVFILFYFVLFCFFFKIKKKMGKIRKIQKRCILCTLVLVSVYTHVHTRVYTSVYQYGCTYIFEKFCFFLGKTESAFMKTSLHTCVYTSVYQYTCMHTDIWVYIWVYIHFFLLGKKVCY